MNGELEKLYAATGRPSIALERLLRQIKLRRLIPIESLAH
jgi:transposase